LSVSSQNNMVSSWAFVLWHLNIVMKLKNELLLQHIDNQRTMLSLTLLQLLLHRSLWLSLYFVLKYSLYS